MAQESKLNEVLRARGNLPQAEKELFNNLFIRPVTETQLCSSMQISHAELQERKTSLLRKLRLNRATA